MISKAGDAFSEDAARDRAALVSHRPQHPQYHRRQAGPGGGTVTAPSRTGWAVCLSPSACTSFQGQAGPWHPRSGRSQKHATCTYTCSSRVPNHHSPRTLTHCAPTQCTVHAPCACTHVQRHLYTPLYMHTVYTHTRPFPEAHTTYLQPQGTTITDLGLPKATRGAECKPACSHTHGHLLKTGADPESHKS